MKFAQCSDSHYGFDHKTHKIYVKFLNALAYACEKEGVEALIHCGDWAINNQHQIERSFKMFRKYLGNLPIYTVRGNHDYWCQDSYRTNLRIRMYKTKWMNGKPYGAMEQDWELWAGDNDISLLENHGPIIKPDKNIAIYGFDGWYDEIPPNTNDHKYMPRVHENAPIDQYLRWKAGKKIDEILEEAAEIKIKYPDIKTILITHFPSYGFEKQWNFMLANQGWMKFIAEKFDYYCVGHSHRRENFIYKSPDNYYMRCINAGSSSNNEKTYPYSYNCPIFTIFDTEEQWDLSQAIAL